MEIEIKNLKPLFRKSLCVFLTVLMLFGSMGGSVSVFAEELTDITLFSIEEDNVTSGNVTDGNVTDGDTSEYVDVYVDETLSVSFADNVCYRFIPEESGYYELSSSSDGDPVCELYDGEMNYITSEDDTNESDFDLSTYFEAGKTYYFVVSFCDYNSYCYITLLFAGEGEDNVTDGNVTDGNVPDDTIDYEDIFVGDTKSGDGVSDQYYRFIPETSGAYCFYSESDGDTDCVLYDADMNRIKSGDTVYNEDEDSYNFNLKYYEFEAGETYYFKVSLWYYNTFCDVKLTALLTPISISFEPVKPFVFDEKISASLRYDENDDEYFCYDIGFSKGDKLTVEYNDGSVKSFEYVPSEYSWLSGRFIGSDGEVLTDVAVSTEQTDVLWSAGTYHATVSYAGKTCSVPVLINECPVETLSAEYKYTLFDKYDCELGSYEASDWSEYINSDDIVYTLKMKDGTEISGNLNVIEDKFNKTPNYSIKLKEIGSNEGKVDIGALEGVFTVNIEEYPVDIAEQPQCIINSSQLDFYEGEIIDYQLICFADKGLTHTIKILEIPEWLTLDNNGRLTGVVPEEHDYKNLKFDVRWDNSYAHYIGDIEINVTHMVFVPDNAEVIPYDTIVDVIASEDEPKWFKFRSYGVYVNVNGKKSDKEDDWDSMNFDLFDSKGIFVTGGFGDSGDGFFWGGYPVKRGEFYYLCIKDSGKIKIDIPEWIPEWTGENHVSSTDELVSTNVEKTFDGDSNTHWNVYSLKGEFDIDFDEGFTYSEFGSLNRLASPVNIHTETINVTSNHDIIYSASYKYDPNNAEECEALGASTTQNTMKDELLPGEKEYRFDNVYYLMPQIGKLTLEEERLIYVPVGYYLNDDNHVVKCTEHNDKETKQENVVDATCTQAGSYEEVVICPICNKEISRVEKTIPSLTHDMDSWTSNNNGTHTRTCNRDICTYSETIDCSYGEWSITSEATCTEEGEKERICIVCKYTEIAVVAVIPHNYINKVPSLKYLAAESTCTSKSTYYMSCDCGVQGTETFEYGISADHADTDGDKICDNCQEIFEKESSTTSLIRNIIELISMLISLLISLLASIS